jgi:hypothetical protein
MTKIGDMRARVLEVIEEHERDGAVPTSIRFVYYELIMRGAVRKDDPDGARYVSAAATDLRESGEVPWDWIVDETRSLEAYTGSRSVHEGTVDALANVVLDPWRGKPPMVITESRSLAGVLRRTVSDYRALVASVNGGCAGFLHTDLIPALGDDARVLYLGDLDLAGGDIEANVRNVVEDEVGSIEWERLALTREQVEQYGLPSVVKRDKRFKGNNGVHEAWECEAISQRILVDTLRTRLEALLPEPLDRVHGRELRQRRKVAAMLRGETL